MKLNLFKKVTYFGSHLITTKKIRRKKYP